MSPEHIVQSYTLDSVDERLIAALASFPRAGVLQLAREVGVARNTVQAHLDRLLAEGVITGFGPELDLRRLGYGVSAFVSLEITQGRSHDVDEHLLDIPEVVEAYMTTGPSDLLCRVVARDNDHLGQVINLILEIPGIARTTTALILATRIAPRSRHVIHAD
ncbi:MAG TPA: Lrp/AsnC family transcriptional regulator [Acidimicrobiales bacterium]|nr:Lrp/AsnC family transcriptional regulator [Acidimicrobiales bacterium]